jgi:hypothetical protein
MYLIIPKNIKQIVIVKFYLKGKCYLSKIKKCFCIIKFNQRCKHCEVESGLECIDGTRGGDQQDGFVTPINFCHDSKDKKN